MKRIKHFALAALMLCGIGLFTACTTEDNPVPSDPSEPAVDPELTLNRELLLNSIEKDTQAMADMIAPEPLNATSQAYAELLALIQRDKNFITNMQTVLTALADRKVSLNPVLAGSELAQMGYVAYITVDNGDFGFRVIFDGKGSSRIVAADQMEFIFPANIAGIGNTLFKVIISTSQDSYQTVADANIKGVQHLACITRMPRSLTMTLRGLINNQELTLSESVIDLQLPESEQSAFVDLKAHSFTLIGRQNSYLNAADGCSLDFSLIMDGTDMTLGYGYSRNEASVIGCVAQMVLPQQGSFIDQMSKNAFSTANLKTVGISIVDDLRLTGTVTSGEDFAQLFMTAIKERQLVGSQAGAEAMAASLNESFHLQLSTEQMSKPEPLLFCAVQQGDGYKVEPALKDLSGDGLIPISQLVGPQTMEYFNKPFELSFTPGGNATSSALQFYSVFMQMMPMSR